MPDFEETSFLYTSLSVNMAVSVPEAKAWQENWSSFGLCSPKLFGLPWPWRHRPLVGCVCTMFGRVLCMLREELRSDGTCPWVWVASSLLKCQGPWQSPYSCLTQGKEECVSIRTWLKTPSHPMGTNMTSHVCDPGPWVVFGFQTQPPGTD